MVPDQYPDPDPDTILGLQHAQALVAFDFDAEHARDGFIHYVP